VPKDRLKRIVKKLRFGAPKTMANLLKHCRKPSVNSHRFLNPIFRGFWLQLGSIWAPSWASKSGVHLPFFARRLQKAPKSAQECPKSAPRASKSAPRVPHERPKLDQETPKSVPRVPKSAPERPKSAQNTQKREKACKNINNQSKHA